MTAPEAEFTLPCSDSCQLFSRSGPALHGHEHSKNGPSSQSAQSQVFGSFGYLKCRSLCLTDATGV